jgi:hypothetical protein
MADSRAFAPVVFLVRSCHRALPARELNGGLRVPRRASILEKLCLIQRAFTARDCICTEEIMKQLGLGIIVAIGLTLPAFGQGVDPLIGSWKLNAAKSTSSAPQMRSLTLTWTGEGQNLIDTADGVDAQGQPYHVVFRHIYDGQPHPTTGSPDFDSTTYTRIGNTINWVRFRQGKTAEVGQAVIVPGKTYTLTNEGIDASNQPYHNVSVFDRQ